MKKKIKTGQPSMQIGLLTLSDSLTLPASSQAEIDAFSQPSEYTSKYQTYPL
ncbi:MAG: hypothetical protein ACJA0G_001101 [Kangiellaceae bacterium]|jgi:hypothetical protein